MTTSPDDDPVAPVLPQTLAVPREHVMAALAESIIEFDRLFAALAK
jgi:hypothetical protein